MNVLKLGRKALTISTVFSTILWSVGVSTLIPAVAQAQACPAFKSGDLIKVTGRPAIYAVDSNGKVLYFPSGDEFKSWNTGETYGGYVSVNQACFDSLPVPTSAPLGVNFRAGSYVVKRASSDQLYVVQPNNMLARITPEAARALYGTNFQAKTVADVFWPNYGSTRGADITEAKAHPGMLISNAGKTYYVNTDGSLSEVTASGFSANRFKQAFVRPVASIAGLTVGQQITAAVGAVADRTQTGGASTTIPGTGTPGQTGAAVTVSLAADNPAGTILASGTAFNPVLKLNLTAGSQAASLTGITLRKTGLAANSVISGVEVVDAQGNRHGNIATSLTTDNDVTVLFASQPITIAAGTTQQVTVRVNLAAGTQSGTFAFSVVGPASLQGVSATGSFPVTGNTFQVQTGTAAVGAATIAILPVNAGGLSINLDAGNQQEITKFRIDAAASQENLRLSKFTVYNNGTAADTDVLDVQLVAQDGTVLATAQQVNKNVVFNLVTPYQIDKGTFKDFTVRAKIVAGIDRYIQYVVYNNYDVVLTGTNTGAGIIAAATGVDASFPVGNQDANYNRITVTSGTVSFNKDISSPSGAVTPGTSGVVLGKWFVKPTGEDVELRSLLVAGTFNVATTSALTGSYTVKVNGVSVYNAAPSELAARPGTTTIDISDVVLPAGQNSFITVESNIPSLASNGTTAQIYLGLGDIRKVITNQISAANTAVIAGNQISVQAAALRVTNLATPVAQSLVAGTTGVELAKIELSANSSGEAVRVSRVVVSDVMSGGALTDIGNLVMVDSAGNQLATTANTATNVASNTFNFVNPITVPQNGTVVLTLKGDVMTGTAGTHRFLVASASDVTAVGQTTGNALTLAAPTGNGQTMTVAAAGTLSLSVVTGGNAAPSNDQTVAAGTTNVPVFAFRLAAQREGIKVTSLKLTATGTINSVNDVVNLKLFKDNETAPFATAGQMTLSSTNTLTYTWAASDNLLPAIVQPGTPVTVYVKADVGGNGSAFLGDKFRFHFATSSDLIAKGASSGTTSTPVGAPAASGFSYVVPFNVSIAGEYPAANTTQQVQLAAGSRVATIKVTNNGASQINVTDIKFTDNSGNAHTGTTYTLRYSSLNTADYATNAAVTADADANFTGMTGITIDGGAHRYFSVYLAGTVNNLDSFQFSVASVGDLKYSVDEAQLLFDANLNGVLTDVATGLVATDKVTLGSVTDPS